MRRFRPDAEHWFAGEHALSGRRTSPAEIHDWYGRLSRVFPGIRFHFDRFIVAGPPWRTHAAMEWTDELYDREGNPMPNRGVFVLELTWTKVRSIHIHCDTALIRRNLALLAAQGVPEAAAPPIETPLTPQPD
jgi:ketosteroid isomerase-like protein